MSIDYDKRDALINDWLDGELEASMRDELARESADELAAAEQLRQLLNELAEEPVPAGLRQRLLGIPEQASAAPGPWQTLRRQLRSLFTLPAAPGWRVALAAVPVVAVALWLQPADRQPDSDEIAQGRRDLAVALAYLQKTHSQAGAMIGRSMDRGLTRPVLGVVEDTVEETVQSQLYLRKET